MVRRKKVAVADVAVNWEEYFNSIRSVCPWSITAWRKQEIQITNWHSHILELGSLQARVYVAPKHNPRQLKKMSDRFNAQRPNEEWLWSHPSYKHHSTPVPVLIQQDRAKLLHIRSKLNDNSEILINNFTQ